MVLNPVRKFHFTLSAGFVINTGNMGFYGGHGYEKKFRDFPVAFSAHQKLNDLFFPSGYFEFFNEGRRYFNYRLFFIHKGNDRASDEKNIPYKIQQR